MKKLLTFAAIAALSASAFAECSEPETKNCAAVYTVKMSVKTTVGKTTKGNAKTCTEGGCVREKGSTKFEGLIYSCECGCDEDTMLSGASFLLWDSKAKSQIADATLTFKLLHRIGKTTKDVEAVWTVSGGDTNSAAEYDLTGAGFGTFDTKASRVKKISGDFAGIIPGPGCSVAATCSEVLAGYWTLCDATATTGDTEGTAAYGTWSFDYNTSASKKYASSSVLPYPSYVTIAE